MNVNMDAEARASLRHFLSAALIFGASLDDKRDPRTKGLEAFDEWFALMDSKAAATGAQLIEDRVTQHGAALQRIGTALGLPAGSDLHRECVPAIESLQAAPPRWRWVDCAPHDGYFERRADGEWVKWADVAIGIAGTALSHTLNTVDESRGADPAEARLASDLPEARSGRTRPSVNQRQGGDQHRPSTTSLPLGEDTWHRVTTDLRGHTVVEAHMPCINGLDAWVMVADLGKPHPEDEMFGGFDREAIGRKIVAALGVTTTRSDPEALFHAQAEAAYMAANPTAAGVPSSYEWLRLNDPAKHAEWAAGNLEPSVVDWMAGWDACRAQGVSSVIEAIARQWDGCMAPMFDPAGNPMGSIDIGATIRADAAPRPASNALPTDHPASAGSCVHGLRLSENCTGCARNAGVTVPLKDEL